MAFNERIEKKLSETSVGSFKKNEHDAFLPKSPSKIDPGTESQRTPKQSKLRFFAMIVTQVFSGSVGTVGAVGPISWKKGTGFSLRSIRDI